jgi:hypothetical protein
MTPTQQCCSGSPVENDVDVDVEGIESTREVGSSITNISQLSFE